MTRTLAHVQTVGVLACARVRCTHAPVPAPTAADVRTCDTAPPVPADNASARYANGRRNGPVGPDVTRPLSPRNPLDGARTFRASQPRCYNPDAMSHDSPAALLARLRNAPLPAMAPPPSDAPAEPETAVAAASRWVAARGLRPGTHAAPPPRLLLPLLHEWLAGQGWAYAPTAIQLGTALGVAGLRRLQRARWAGYGTTRAQAALLWAEVRARHPDGIPEAGRQRRRQREPSAPRKPLPPVLPLPSAGHPLVDSHGAVWHSAAQAAQALKVDARNLFRALDGEYESCAGRLWRRLPEDESWVARLPPGARVGQPGTLCLCAGVPPLK